MAENDQEQSANFLLGIRKKRGREEVAKPASLEAEFSDERERLARAAQAKGTDSVEREDDMVAEDESEESDSDDELAQLGLDKAERKRLRHLPELEREIELANRQELAKRQQLRAKLDAPTSSVPEKPQRRGNRERASRQEPPGEVRRSGRQQPAAKASKAGALADMKANRERLASVAVESAVSGDDDDFYPSPRAVAAGAEGGPGSCERLASSEEGEEGEERWGGRGSVADAAATEGRFSDGESGLGAGESPVGHDAEGRDFGDEAGRDDVLKMQVLREELEDWVRQPELEEKLRGALVRAQIGADNRSGLSRVVGVQHGAVYKFGADPGRPTTSTDIHLVVSNPQTGKQTTITCGIVSNRRATEDDFKAFHAAHAAAGLPMVSQTEADTVQVRLEAARLYVVTPQDIQRLVQRNAELGRSHKGLQKQRSEAVIKRDSALEEGDAELHARMVALIAELDGRLAARQVQRTAGEVAASIASVNRRAARDNRMRLTGAVGAARFRDAALGPGPGGPGGGPVSDPYLRKKTKAKQYWRMHEGGAEGQKQPGGDFSPSAAAPAKDKARAALPIEEELRSMELPRCSVPAGVDVAEVVAARQLVGPQCRPRLTVHPRDGYLQVISWQDYQNLVQDAGYRMLGID